MRFIDLGIVVDGKRIKWATTNVGAKNPWDYGDYYAWGEIETKEAYNESFSNYTFYDNGSFTKYNATDKISSLQSDDDIATVTFGNNCVMPTPAEWAALHTNCEWKWISSYKGTSVNGYAVFKKKAAGSYSIDSDPHIFLPAGGSYINGNINKKGSDGWYWSSLLFNEKKYETASELHINSSTIDHNEESRRFYGLSIRPIMRKNAYINLDKREASVYPGKTINLKATTDPANENVEWKSDDATIATVSNGVVTGKTPGTTTITATYNGQDAVCIVTVLVPPEKITLSGASYANPYVWGTENVATKQFIATVTPTNANDKSVTWTSSNTNIITVDQSGNVKIIAPNETSDILDVTITATSNYDNSIKASYTIHLDNYVDLGTGEAYWKTTNEQFNIDTDDYNELENTLGIQNITSKYDFENLLNKCTIEKSKIKNKNNSGAYINCDPGFYITNTNYGLDRPVFEANSSGNDRIISAWDAYEAVQNGDNKNYAVRCVRRFGTIKVKEIRIDGFFSDPYVWGRDVSSNHQISCYVYPTFADNTNVTWSSNNSIATVSNGGTVTIVAPNESDGNAKVTITATAQDGSGVKATYSFNVANYVDLGTSRVYWYTKNATRNGASVFLYSDAENYLGKANIPKYEDYQELLNTDNYHWKQFGSNNKVTHYRVTNRSTGVYIEFPVVGNNNVDDKNEGYWTSSLYIAGQQNGLVLEDNGTFKLPPTLAAWRLSRQWTLPVRFIKPKEN